ncbi:hypothetical protein ABW21_db0205764 [Orbilia brochopaga]|nr:hypothetical protein ABW21_db0205764 [Drechslerella brochopaga]
MRDVRLLQLVKELVNVSKFHIYHVDIHDTERPEPWPEPKPVDGVTKLRWAHIFNAAAELEKLVDFQAGNISYKSVREEYKELDVKQLWIFTTHQSDFESLKHLKQSQIAKGGNVKNATFQQGWFLDETSKMRGITLDVIGGRPEYSHLAKKNTERDYIRLEARRRYWRYYYP